MGRASSSVSEGEAPYGKKATSTPSGATKTAPRLLLPSSRIVLLTIGTALLIQSQLGGQRERINPSGVHFEVVNGTRFGPTRRTVFAERLDGVFDWVFALGLLPSHYKNTTITNFRRARGFPREDDPFPDADVFDDFIDRCGLKPVRDGDFNGEPLTSLGTFASLIGVSNLVDMRRRMLPENVPESTRAVMAAEPVPRRSIYIVSMPRSGTTIMQRILASDPKSRAFTLAEIRDPVRNGRRIDASGQIALVRLLSPHLLSIHPMQMDFPDEETFLMNAQLPIMGSLPVVAAQEFFNELSKPNGPMVPVYQTLTGWLKLMAATYASPEHERLIYKSPFHLFFVDDLLASLKDETPVVLIRNKRDDLVKVMTSLLSLFRAQQEIFFMNVDLDHIEEAFISPKGGGKSFPELIVEKYKRLNEINATTHHTVIDVEFDDIVRNPVGVMRALYSRVDGMEFTSDLEGLVQQAFESSKHASDEYKEYHGFPLKPSSIEHIRSCEAEISKLMSPIPVE